MTGLDGPTPGSGADDSEPADPESVARAILLRQLTMGPRTRAQLAQALARRQVPEVIAEQVLDRFTEVGLIDDADYAEALIRTEAAAGSLSRRRVAQRLRERGVDPEVIAAAVSQIDARTEYESALELARRRARRVAGLDAATARRRLAGVLARRGYGSETVRRAVAEVLGPGET